jgi:hypothetical protein
MKKIATVVFALLIGASLSFAQTGGGTTDKNPKVTKTEEKAHKGGKKGHKGGKKSKKNSGGSTTPPPK